MMTSSSHNTISFSGWFVFLGFLGLILGVEPADNKQLIPKFKFAGKVDKYGCRFLNNEYDLDRKPLFVPQYGDVVKPLVIADVKELESLIKELEKINRDIAKKNIFNSVDNYLEFYQGYQKYRSDRNITEPNYLDFVNFFKGFKPKFVPREDFMGQTIEVLDQISQNLSGRWPKITKSIYPVSYEMAVTVGFMKTLKRGARLGNREMSRMAAATKISYAKKLGYIICDPSFNIVEAKLVMEDGSNPLKELAEKKSVQNERSDLTILPYNKNYIVKNPTSVNYDDDSYEVHFLIYVGQAYCSFLDTTGKYGVLREFRGIMKRDANGSPVAGFYTTCLPQGRASMKDRPQAPSFNLFYREEALDDEDLTYTIKFESLLGDNPRQKLTPKEDDVIRIANKECGFTTEDGLINKLKQLAEILVKDEGFLISVLNIRPHLQELDTYDPRGQSSGQARIDEESENYYKKEHCFALRMLKNSVKKIRNFGF